MPRTWPNGMTGYPRQPRPSYALADVDLLRATELPDIVPADSDLRRSWATALATDATVYGLAAVLQYRQMYRQAVDSADPSFTGFNRLRHDRELARPGYAEFTTANVDTLYSHAWLDLSGGPVVLDVPPMGARYYTLHFLDAYSNATNLSTRTLGPDGGRVAVAPVSWPGPDLVDGAPVFRVATPYVWLLMRILVRGPDDLPEVHRLQDAVRLTAPADRGDRLPFVVPPPIDDDLDGRAFVEILDDVIRRNGHPVQEDALVHRYRGLGIGLDGPVDPATWDDALMAAVEEGYRLGLRLAAGVRGQRGMPAPGGTGWRTLDSGSYGFNYLHRAATNLVGLGATVREENASFTTFLDGDGEALDGSRGTYRVSLEPPPVDGFWSLTVYDGGTQDLHPNPLDRYGVNDQDPALPGLQEGRVELVLSPDPPDGADAHWLPVPAGPFYVVIRAYLAGPAVLTGEWTPPAVRPAKPTRSTGGGSHPPKASTSGANSRSIR
jgi:hypothetical protein